MDENPFDLQQTLEGSLSEFMAERGCVLVGFTAYVDYVDAEGEGSWMMASRKNQNRFESLQHVHVLKHSIDHEIRKYFERMDE